jgi:hypothetical protein
VSSHLICLLWQTCYTIHICDTKPASQVKAQQADTKRQKQKADKKYLKEAAQQNQEQKMRQ